VQTLQVVLRNLPLEAALEVFRYLEPREQLAMANIIFGRIVSWRKAVRRKCVPPEQVEAIQRLISEYVDAARKAQEAR
jgi:hypothetical protein